MIWFIIKNLDILLQMCVKYLACNTSQQADSYLEKEI